ncbi:MAG: glycerol kinase GlpK [Chloroflexi bacterium]|nr:glycerol kinase GlpK [Chloroflexota bacterium]MBT4073125.1 glycerol kinase GlpK [Chloroflexota bacterium]MBT4515103.1 glycerol kinase GlpK [Chloroflexota bacterium]MBT5320141.1 glycerol kinase GlpK [Chloroflexota bacterium]MBT6682822.1 glycerol kinase GlpK [Chloroflexota bacterium]
MSEGRHILAIDQGTTSSRAIVFDDQARPVASAQVELTQHFPQPGWVEHDASEIYDGVLSVARDAIKKSGVGVDGIAAIGITNQRETVVVWDQMTGEPVSNAIVWQCRRTADACAELIRKGHSEVIRDHTGLVVDPYFSATKLRWLLDRIPNGQRKAEDGELCFGTVDSWLMYKLSGGKSHVTDVTNASRTMLLNIQDLEWDPAMLDLFAIPEAILPDVLPSAGDFAITDVSVLGAEIPITGVAGDQHAALFGQACFKTGMTKCTYGTGAFVLTNAGQRVPSPEAGILSTVGWQVGSKRAYASEGGVFVTGAAVQWLRDGLGVIGSASEANDLAVMLGDNDGVYMVPAFVGLGAPRWDPDARGTITGLTRGSSREHLARAALEATAYQVRDVIHAMTGSGKGSSTPLRADGGQTASPFLMQFQADILDRPVEVSEIAETTALGAAFLAGRGMGLWRSDAEVGRLSRAGARYEPAMADSQRARLITGWYDAVERTASVTG